jgi:tetratricopeptide (TPR) repeat protein
MPTRKRRSTRASVAGAAIAGALMVYGCALRPADIALEQPEIYQPEDVATDTDPAQVYTNLGNEYYDKGMFAQAVDEYHRAIEVNPYADAAHAGTGMAFYKLGRRDDAERSFRRALRLNERNIIARNGLALVVDDHQERAAQMEAAISYNPDMPELRNNLCYFLAESGEYDRAVTECQASIRLDSLNFHAHYNLGYAYQRQGRLDQALDEYQLARQLNPGWARVMNNMALVYYYKSRFSDSIEAYENAIAADGSEGVFHYNLALAYEALAHRIRALEDEGSAVPETYGVHGSQGWRMLYRRAADGMRTYLDMSPNAPNSSHIRVKINELRRRAS